MSVAAPPSVSPQPSPEPESGGSSRRQPVRNAVISALSATVLLAGVLFVALPAQAGVAFAVTQREAASSAPIVYGKVVDRHGDPVVDAHVRLVRWVHGHRHVLRSRITSDKGLYRFVVRHRQHHRVTLRIVGSLNGHRYAGTHKIHLHPGTAFSLRATFVKQGGFFFLPVSTY